MRWNRSMWVPSAWATAALIGVGVRHADDRAAGVRGASLSSVVTMRVCISVKLSPLGEAERRRCALHGAPLGQLHQLLQLAAGPVAEVALEQAAVDLRPQAAGLGDRRRRLLGAFER